MRGECASRNRVGPRTVAADLVALNTMLNWATRERDRRREPLLTFNPLRAVKDVAAAGGWSDTATLLRSYQQSDEVTPTQVALEAPKLTARGAGGNEVTPLLTPPQPSTRAGDKAQRQAG